MCVCRSHELGQTAPSIGVRRGRVCSVRRASLGDADSASGSPMRRRAREWEAGDEGAQRA